MADVADAFAVPAIVGPDGRPLGETSPAIVHADADMRALVDSLGRQPYDLMTLDPREFEKIVAHLLDRDGYEVKLQPKSGRGHPDHGIDILAVRKQGVGQFVMGIQCKRKNTDNKVSGAMVRELMGSLLWSNLDRGVLVTTSEFQPQAFEYEQGAPHKAGVALDLVDYHRLVRWLKVYGRSDEDDGAGPH
ncbi:MAG: restriction endonuclease [Deltaproteobacteria bacterium]|nr:restriction endonuclease [Deltaproteobacteria bacterium]